MNLSDEGTTNLDECEVKSEGYDDARYALVVYIGTPLALCGLFFNLFLVKQFCDPKKLKTPSFYLFLLSICDSIICFLYFPFFTVDAISIYYENKALHHMWHSYVMLLHGTSRVVQFTSTWMVVCATLERFIVVGNVKRLAFVATTKGRYMVVSIALMIILILRTPTYFDYRPVFLPDCPVFQDYRFDPLLLQSEFYGLFNFYILSVIQLIVPFIVLASLNLLIIAMTKRKIYSHYGTSSFAEMPQISSLLRKESINSNRKHRDELRYATRTMLAIVFTYLICNILGVFITVIENVFKDSTIIYNADGSSTTFYTYTADLISIMAVLNSFLRIFIYFFCNPQFRFQIVTSCRRAYSRLFTCPEDLEYEYTYTATKFPSPEVVEKPIMTVASPPSIIRQVRTTTTSSESGANLVALSPPSALKKSCKKRLEGSNVKFDLGSDSTTHTGDTCYL